MGPGGCQEPGREPGWDHGQEAARLAGLIDSDVAALVESGPLPRLEVTLTCPVCQAQVSGHVPQAPGRGHQEEAVAALLEAEALAQAAALVRADQEGITPGDLLAIAERALRMAAGLREHLVAGSLLDAWAAADWLGDLAQEVKDKLPVSSQDILAAVEGHQLPEYPRPAPEAWEAAPQIIDPWTGPPQPREGGEQF